MAEKPTIFSGPLVRAILGGRKTQTRRLPTERTARAEAVDAAGYSLGRISWKQLLWDHPAGVVAGEGGAYLEVACLHQRGLDASDPNNVGRARVYPRIEAQDVLWVRETLRRTGDAPYHGASYDADGTTLRLVSKGGHVETGAAWTFGERPVCVSIHMPRSAARLFLRVKAVRAERLQDITTEDIIAEGISSPLRSINHAAAHLREQWIALWDSINGKRDGASWGANPWVWVVEFERVEAPDA